MDREEEGYIPPVSASPIPPPPYHMSSESQYVYVFFDTDEAELAWEVPEPLELADSDDPLAYVAIGDGFQPPKNMAQFHEGIFAIRVEFEGTEGWYIPYIWVSNEESMLNGRVFGWPKQLCDNDPLAFEGNEIQALLNRRGKTLFDVTFSPRSPPQKRGGEKVKQKMAELKGDVPSLQYKKVQSPAKDGKVLRQVMKNDIEEFDAAEIWEGTAHLEINGHGSYPHLDALQPERIRSAFYLRPDFILDNEGAEIVWERFD